MIFCIPGLSVQTISERSPWTYPDIRLMEAYINPVLRWGLFAAPGSASCCPGCKPAAYLRLCKASKILLIYWYILLEFIVLRLLRQGGLVQATCSPGTRVSW